MRKIARLSRVWLVSIREVIGVAGARREEVGPAAQHMRSMGRCAQLRLACYPRSSWICSDWRGACPLPCRIEGRVTSRDDRQQASYKARTQLVRGRTLGTV